jgi:hypothetical protein
MDPIEWTSLARSSYPADTRWKNIGGVNTVVTVEDRELYHQRRLWRLSGLRTTRRRNRRRLSIRACREGLQPARGFIRSMDQARPFDEADFVGSVSSK